MKDIGHLELKNYHDEHASFKKLYPLYIVKVDLKKVKKFLRIECNYSMGIFYFGSLSFIYIVLVSLTKDLYQHNPICCTVVTHTNNILLY